MPKYLTLDEAYLKCTEDGMFIPLSDVDIEKIKCMLSIVQEDELSIGDLTQKSRWNTMYKLSYDVIHTLVEALLLFKKTKSSNHQCLFAFLCNKYSHLELDWDFFEKIRTKRNGIHYYGASISKFEFKEIQVQLKLYVLVIKKEIDINLKSIE